MNIAPTTPLDAKRILGEIAAQLLDPSLDYIRVRDTCACLTALCHEITGFDPDEKINLGDLESSGGLAVGPAAAAICITDMMRTRNFLQAIEQAINERLEVSNGQPITILYAGTGPFATLVLPLTSVFTPLQIKLVLLEINPVSITYLKKLIHFFDLYSYVIDDVVLADAVTYKIPAHQQPDIIISETMKSALRKEPQVNITVNLITQCSRNPVLIPENIKVETGLAGGIALNPRPYHALKTLFELNAATAVQIKNNPSALPVLSKGIEIELAEMDTSMLNRLVLRTSITIYKHHCLLMNESGLTLLYILADITRIKAFPVRFCFKYQLENEPGFRLSVIN